MNTKKIALWLAAGTLTVAGIVTASIAMSSGYFAAESAQASLIAVAPAGLQLANLFSGLNLWLAGLATSLASGFGLWRFAESERELIRQAKQNK